MKSFHGFEREDGSVGTRNYVAVIPTVFVRMRLLAEIAKGFSNCRPILHNKGCGQLEPDLEIINRTLKGLGLNPNVGAVLLVGLGCEAISIETVFAAIAEKKSAVEKLVIHEIGGMANAVHQGRRIVEKMIHDLSGQETSLQPMEKICLAIKCGSSDATSGLAANPATGKAVNHIIEKGGTVVFGETTEFIGAEHILARRGIDTVVSEKIYKIVNRMEKRVIQMGVDMRGTQPSPGNIAGGLTTIEEKSLGAISKSGTCPITSVYDYGERVEESGLFIMDSPGKEDEFLTGVSAAGANIIIFTTGGGAPQGFPIVPVVKVASNPEKIGLMREHVDIDAGSIIEGKRTISDLGHLIVNKIMDVASGEKTAAENNQYDKSIGIYTLGPTL